MAKLSIGFGRFEKTMTNSNEQKKEATSTTTSHVMAFNHSIAFTLWNQHFPLAHLLQHRLKPMDSRWIANTTQITTFSFIYINGSGFVSFYRRNCCSNSKNRFSLNSHCIAKNMLESTWNKPANIIYFHLKCCEKPKTFRSNVS